MHAVSRLLQQGARGAGPEEVRDRLVSEARAYFHVSRALLLAVDELEGRIDVAAGDPAVEKNEELLAIVDVPPVVAVIDERQPVHVAGGEAGALAETIGAGDDARSVLLLPINLHGPVGYALALLDQGERQFRPDEVEVAAAFASAAAAGLAQLQSATDYAAQTELQAALARAAKTLNDSLDLDRVLLRICQESTSILDGDVAAVYTGNAREGLRMDAVLGFPPEALGTRLEPGEGLAGRAAESGAAQLTNDYAAMRDRARSPLFDDIRSSLAVPMHWDGELRGVLTVGYTHEYPVSPDQLGLLEAFAELAAAACRNASAHAGLALAALTDALTGCLNHAALHEALQRECERCRRTGQRLSLAILDLDDFKQVNERNGHLAGDEVLRAAGIGLRGSVRAYDLVARYGGDEFAIVVMDAGEAEAAELAGRSREALGTPATGGVAEWISGESSTQLIERADRALLHAKHHGGRGTVVRSSQVPGQEALSESR
jgi:diguanylate cyclase (GGDEF)-like protein